MKFRGFSFRYLMTYPKWGEMNQRTRFVTHPVLSPGWGEERTQEQDSYHPLASCTLVPRLRRGEKQTRHLSPLASCTLVPRLRKGEKQTRHLSPLASCTLVSRLRKGEKQTRHLSPLASCSLVPRLQSEGDLYCHLVSGGRVIVLKMTVRLGWCDVHENTTFHTRKLCLVTQWHHVTSCDVALNRENCLHHLSARRWVIPPCAIRLPCLAMQLKWLHHWTW